MPHVGNDIVDLNRPGTTGRARDSRFVDRVLTPGEKERLYGHKDPDRLLWAFWAAKESAYKAVSKTNREISSAPRRYPVTLFPGISKSLIPGNVLTPAGPVAVRIFIGEGHVHCIGTTGGLPDLDRSFHAIKKVCPAPGNESIRVRELAKERIAQHLDMAPHDIRIQRPLENGRPGPPVIRIRNRKPPMDISLSHHGRYLAFAAFGKGADH